MELFIFARFHARERREQEVAAALTEQVLVTRAESGCLAKAAYRSVRDPRLFWIHSRWIDEATFRIHADLPNTVRLCPLFRYISTNLAHLRTSAG
jgi:quinol monooxygenase YgiN